MDWNEVKAELEQVLDAGGAAREELLRDLTTRDSELAREVRSLLAHSDAAAGFLDREARAWTEPPPPPSSAAWQSGARLGGYELVRCLGAGGMGTVWEATQTSPSRRVAIKLLGGGPRRWSRSERWRFEYEAEVLASLRHPSIAQVYETGCEDSDGRETLWFAMELVEGARDLAGWLRHTRPTRAERLRLFRELCSAVQHGHQRGVIHRDLKPSNVLVDRAGRLKLIDFGIARAVAGSSASPSMRTRTGVIVGTLPYLAPEQLGRGGGTSEGDEELDLRCDVYALGVLLYELLSDATPFDVADLPLPEIARVIAEEEPVPPSRRDPSLAGDLEWIVLRALEKEPARRYATVGELSDELGRYERNEPVLACPPSRTYRLSKFVRRHRALVLGTLAILLGLVLAVVGITAGLFEARRNEVFALAQSAKAQREADRSRAILELVQGLFQGVKNTVEGREVTVLELLEAAVLDFEQREQASSVEREVEFEFRTTVGEMYAHLGRHDEARVQYGRAFELAEGEGEFPVPRVTEAMSGLASAMARTGESEAGEALLKDAVAFARAAGEAQAARVAAHRLSIHFEARLDHRQMYDLAQEFLAESRRAGDRFAEESFLAQAAVAARGLGQYEEAVELAREHLALRTELMGADDPETLLSWARLALALESAGRVDEADELYERLLPKCRDVLGPAHSVTLMATNNYADVFKDRGDFESMVEVLTPLVAAYEQAEGRPSVSYMRSVNNLGMAYKNGGDQAGAEPYLRRAVEIAEQVLPADDLNTAIFRLNLGSCLERQGRFDEALPSFRAAWERVRHEAEGGPIRGPTERVIGGSFRRHRSPEEAESWRELLAADSR